MVRTTVTLARDLWEGAQITAIRSGLSFTEVVSSALKKYLEIIEADKADRETPAKKKEKVRIE